MGIFKKIKKKWQDLQRKSILRLNAEQNKIVDLAGKEESSKEESFSKMLGRKKEYPHYTRPEDFRGLKVPDVLLSGNHAEIEKWRREQCT